MNDPNRGRMVDADGTLRPARSAHADAIIIDDPHPPSRAVRIEGDRDHYVWIEPTEDQAAFLAPVNAAFAKFAERVEACAGRFKVDPASLERVTAAADRRIWEGDVSTAQSVVDRAVGIDDPAAPIPLEPLPRSRRGLAFEVRPGEVTSLRPSAAAAFAALTARQT